MFSAMQSLGETQIDLGPAIVPPPTSLMESSHDSRSRSPLVGQEGDINDTVIDNIVEEDSSVEDDGKTMFVCSVGYKTLSLCVCVCVCACVCVCVCVWEE